MTNSIPYKGNTSQYRVAFWCILLEIDSVMVCMHQMQQVFNVAEAVVCIEVEFFRSVHIDQNITDWLDCHLGTCTQGQGYPHSCVYQRFCKEGGQQGVLFPFSGLKNRHFPFSSLKKTILHFTVAFFSFSILGQDIKCKMEKALFPFYVLYLAPPLQIIWNDFKIKIPRGRLYIVSPPLEGTTPFLHVRCPTHVPFFPF